MYSHHVIWSPLYNKIMEVSSVVERLVKTETEISVIFDV